MEDATEILSAPAVTEFLGIIKQAGEISLLWRDVKGQTAAIRVPRSEAVRLTRMLLTELGPQKPFPKDQAQYFAIQDRRST